MGDTSALEMVFRAGFAAGFDVSREGFNRECAFDHLAPDVDARSVDDALKQLVDRAWADTKPCECGCGRFGPKGMMEAIHPEDYRYDERA